MKAYYCFLLICVFVFVTVAVNLVEGGGRPWPYRAFLWFWEWLEQMLSDEGTHHLYPLSPGAFPQYRKPDPPEPMYRSAFPPPVWGAYVDFYTGETVWTR